MSVEEKIKQELEEKFPSLKDAVQIRRVRRISLDVPYENFREILDHVVTKMSFGILHTITGLDEGENFGIIYHLGREGGEVLNLKTYVPKAKPLLKTVTSYFAVADIYEREMADLLGVQVTGLPPGPRYPLPDNWPKDEYPLRKDWKGMDEKEGGA